MYTNLRFSKGIEGLDSMVAECAENIAKTFVETALASGSKDAVIEAKTGRSISFADLNTRADSYAHYLRGEGVKPGETIILMVKPSIEFICLTLALFKVGSPVILIDPGMGFKNLLRCIKRVEPRYLIGIPKAILFSKLFPKPFRSVVKRFCCGFSFGLLGQNINNMPCKLQSEYEVYTPTADDLAAIIFTTGSTGPPKGVRYEHSIFSAQLELIKSYYKIGDQDVDQPAFPLFALFSTALGACAIIPDMDPTKPAQVDAKKFTDSIDKYRVSYSFGSPAIWRVVSTYCAKTGRRLPTLTKVLMAGAPVPYEVLKIMRKILPEDGKVFTPYGATESLPIASIDHDEILDETMEMSRVGRGTCVGRSLPGVDIRIIALSDDGLSTIAQCSPLPTGEIGEIIVRGDNVTRAYMNNDEETRMSKIADGERFWHRMGDLGYLDNKGRLWFCGRKAHRVVCGDVSYYSIPCEAIVNEHENVYRSALVGVTDENGATLPAIIVEPVKEFGGSEAELLNEVRELARKSEVTEDIDKFLLHPEFPVDIRHNAKIFREKLSVWAQEKMYP